MKLLVKKSVLPFILFCVGCGPSAEPTKPDRPSLVGPEALVDAYHSGRRHYTGRLVSVCLTSGTYRVRPGRVDARLCGPDEMIRFEVQDKDRIDADCDIEVIGVCEGIVKDGTVRCVDLMRIDWYVRVVNCEVRVIRGP